MKNYRITTLIIVAVVACVSTVSAGATEQEALKDWGNLERAYKDMKKDIEPVVPSYAPNIIGSDYTKILAVLDNYEKLMKPKFQKQLDEFSQKYGKTASEINETMKTTVKDGEHPSTSAGDIYERLKKFMDNVQQARINKSRTLVQDAQSIQRTIDSFESQANEKNYDKLKQTLGFAIKFNPENKTAKDMLAKVDKQRADKLAAINKRIDETKWPGNYKNFAGPGDSEALAAVALAYLRNDEGWGGNKKNTEHCLAVAIRGNWGSHKKNILGQTVQWYLPIYLAVYKDTDEESVARVFELSVLTREGPGEKKAPPFAGVTVGNIWKIRRKNVPGGGGGADSQTVASDGQSGFTSMVFRLALAFGNIIAGLLAAAPLIRRKVPKLNSVYEKITPLSNMIGVVVLAIGVITLLIAVFQLFLLRFVIFANIVPQLTAIAVGFFLGKELLFKKSHISGKAGEAVEKTQEFLKKYDDKMKQLERYQIPLGFVCLVVGLIHLFLAPLPLF